MVVVSVLLAGPVLWLILRSVASSPTRPIPDGEKETGGGLKERVYDTKEKTTRMQERDLGFGLVCLYMLAPILAEPVPLFPRWVASHASPVFLSLFLWSVWYAP